MLLCQEKHIDELIFWTVWSSLWQKAMRHVLHLDFGTRVTIDRATGRVYV